MAISNDYRILVVGYFDGVVRIYKRSYLAENVYTYMMVQILNDTTYQIVSVLLN